jgi:hypothetical protein
MICGANRRISSLDGIFYAVGTTCFRKEAKRRLAVSFFSSSF